MKFKAWLPFSPPVFSARFFFFCGNSVLLAMGVVLMLLEIFEFFRGKIFLFLWNKSGGNPFYICTVLLPTLSYLVLTQEGCLHALYVSLRLSFHTWGWMDSCAQAAGMPSCSCVMSGADAVGHEQWICLDNSLPSGIHFYWFYSWIIRENFLPSRLKWLIASFWTLHCKELKAKALSDYRQNCVCGYLVYQYNRKGF